MPSTPRMGPGLPVSLINAYTIPGKVPMLSKCSRTPFQTCLRVLFG